MKYRPEIRYTVATVGLIKSGSRGGDIDFEGFEAGSTFPLSHKKWLSISVYFIQIHKLDRYPSTKKGGRRKYSSFHPLMSCRSWGQGGVESGIKEEKRGGGGGRPNFNDFTLGDLMGESQGGRGGGVTRRKNFKTNLRKICFLPPSISSHALPPLLGQSAII